MRGNARRTARLGLLLTLSALVTACVPNDLPDPLPPNAASAGFFPEVAAACGTVLWSVQYLRDGVDVTHEALHRLRGTTGLSSPTYTLSPGTDRQRFITEPHSAGGTQRLDDPAFADVVHHTFTCTADGQSVHVGRTRWYGDNTVGYFSTVTVRYADGQLTVN